MTDDTLEITYLSVDELVPYENNPRTNDNTIPFLQNSFRNAGFIVPIVVDRNKTIAAGHTRVKAIKPLMDAGEHINFVKGRMVPCVFAEDLTDEQIARFRLEDNRVSDFSEWDWDLLIPELEGIKMMDIDPADIGFNIPEMEEEPEEPELDTPFEEEEIEYTCPEFEDDEGVVIRYGDVIRLGNHLIICGDLTCTGRPTPAVLSCEEDGEDCIVVFPKPGSCQAAVSRWCETTGSTDVTVFRGSDAIAYKDL